MKHRSQPPLQSDDRTVVIGTRTEEDFWADFHRKETAEQTPPKGSISAQQYGERFDISRASAQCLLDRRVQAGEFKSDLFRVQSGGMRRAVRFYWPAAATKRR